MFKLFIPLFALLLIVLGDLYNNIRGRAHVSYALFGLIRLIYKFDNTVCQLFLYNKVRKYFVENAMLIQCEFAIHLGEVVI